MRVHLIFGYTEKAASASPVVILLTRDGDAARAARDEALASGAFSVVEHADGVSGIRKYADVRPGADHHALLVSRNVEAIVEEFATIKRRSEALEAELSAALARNSDLAEQLATLASPAQAPAQAPEADTPPDAAPPAAEPATPSDAPARGRRR